MAIRLSDILSACAFAVNAHSRNRRKGQGHLNPNDQFWTIYGNGNVFSPFYLAFTKKKHTFALALGPDGGIGRRVGLKHQYRKVCRFDPGSGYKEDG